MLDTRTVNSIIDAVNANFDKQIEVTREIVAIPSQRGQETAAQEFMYEAMRSRGLKLDRWTIDIEDIRDHPGFSPVTIDYANAVNVVGTHQPGVTEGRSLILNGHIDVVPTGPPDMWTYPPYEPHIRDGWLYGRGAGDMKAGLIANLFAYDALRDAGFEPAATVHLQSVVEEECTGNGALACLMRGYHADAALITEPMGDGLARANVGVLWFRVEVQGRPAHVSESYCGANAIGSMYGVIKALSELESRWNERKVAYRYFEHAIKPITINVGKIEGGDWASSVPCWCRIDARAGIYPGVSVEDAQAEIEATINAACQQDAYLSQHPATITYNGFTTQGYVLEEGSEAEACLRDAHARIFQSELDAGVCPAYLDARVFVLYDDTPALVYGPVSERIHGFDERVNLTSVRQITQSIALFMAGWCGIHKLT